MFTGQLWSILCLGEERAGCKSISSTFEVVYPRNAGILMFSEELVKILRLVLRKHRSELSYEYRCGQTENWTNHP